MNVIRQTWNESRPLARWAIGLGGTAFAGSFFIARGLVLPPGVNAMGSYLTYGTLVGGATLILGGVLFRKRSHSGLFSEKCYSFFDREGIDLDSISCYRENEGLKSSDKLRSGKGPFHPDMLLVSKELGKFSDGVPYIALKVRYRGSKDDQCQLLRRLTISDRGTGPACETTCIDRPYSVLLLYEKDGRMYHKPVIANNGVRDTILFPSPMFYHSNCLETKCTDDVTVFDFRSGTGLASFRTLLLPLMKGKPGEDALMEMIATTKKLSNCSVTWELAS